jgi:hypothetical protein
MLDNERFDEPLKEGLPPRDRSADVPEHAGTSKIWMGGIIAVGALVALIMFGRPGNNGNSAMNTEPGVTTGAAPAAPSKPAQ